MSDIERSVAESVVGMNSLVVSESVRSIEPIVVTALSEDLIAYLTLLSAIFQYMPVLLADSDHKESESVKH